MTVKKDDLFNNLRSSLNICSENVNVVDLSFRRFNQWSGGAEDINSYSKIAKKFGPVERDIFDALAGGMISSRDILYVLRQLIDLDNTLSEIGKIVYEKGDIKKIKGLLAKVNGSIDRAYKRLNGRPSVQRHLDRVRASIMQMRKAIFEYLKS